VIEAEPTGIETWPALPIGTELTIVKLSPEGEPVTTYPGWVIDAGAPVPWIAARAEWVRKVVELDGLQFIPGDRLHEFFSPVHPFNLFSVWSPEGVLRGWYANVTYPSRLDGTTLPMTLYWHDLYVDVIGLPDGGVAVRDEDELHDARVAERNPALYAMITSARDELLHLLRTRQFPFHEG
jgi:predicted RNA-binding protein associated with RNAse of E/G family